MTIIQQGSLFDLQELYDLECLIEKAEHEASLPLFEKKIEDQNILKKGIKTAILK
ncbi:hypothetical protein [Scopulibacillus cellulosilyticus]|uniref:Uncharacterized protein n=1 Tax=Scopulibacillus cellulosilyticus TaxID=2665665 RepID=A0ABW2Q096_9BACL